MTATDAPPYLIGLTYDYTVTVEHKDTVAALIPSMPAVAATPYLVTVAEIACYQLILDHLEPGQITVGARVVIDHLGASKVGAKLVAHARLRARIKNRFIFDVTIKDGERTVAQVEHHRAAVALQKMLNALN